MGRRPIWVQTISDEQRASSLSDLERVGCGKIIGYLPLQTVRIFLGLKVKDVVHTASSRGVSAISIGPKDCCIKSGALFVYDRTQLAALLEASTMALEQSNFPGEPELFVRAIARDWLEADHPVMPIIRAAFANGHRPAVGQRSL
ncbi:hypothetical protein FG93_00967 [Bosea sp. LC85]|nr:hypothetical protein FG93_00967 [Bosea sp. LC85]